MRIIGRLRERNARVDEWAHRCQSRQQRPDFAFERGGDGAFFSGRAKSQRGPRQREAFEHNQPQWNPRVGTAHQSDLHQPAISREALQIARRVVTADDIENHVHTAVCRSDA